MTVSLNFLIRIAGMLVLAYIGRQVGLSLSAGVVTDTQELATALLTLAGAGLGLLTTHRWTIEPIQRAIKHVRGISIIELVALVFGTLIGLLFGLLLAVPLGYLPWPFGRLLPVLVAVGLGYIGALVFSARRREIGELLHSARRAPFPTISMPGEPQARRYLVDTSAIIDGRVAGVVDIGFLDGTLQVPRFVLAELQTLADSADELKRGRGRRGLEILNTLQKKGDRLVEILDVDVNGPGGVDEKLVALARRLACPIITNDYNLAKVAELQGVSVLSLNQLADVVRPPVMPGQELHITIRDIGREREQGVSFLPDGTMVVVEDARRLIGQEVYASVTRVYQTQTGRIVFAQLVPERVARAP